MAAVLNLDAVEQRVIPVVRVRAISGGLPARAASISSAIAWLRRCGRDCQWAREATTGDSISFADNGAPSIVKLARPAEAGQMLVLRSCRARGTYRGLTWSRSSCAKPRISEAIIMQQEMKKGRTTPHS
ncbi:hypothetical protein CVM52_02285 [Pseudooceanicola lipolyticus]|uniref:Uncharacterized protein n=1 Tax=Pseudooceanicola lipolyticus TaxID=2029104 RepID=A0A2M8J647_9RHOB|nr:hypothetical protein CVM52_02285 [Pseudooceanicola lipolyticus]